MTLHTYNESRLFRFRTNLVSHAWNASWRVRCWAAARAPAGSSAPDWNWSNYISTRECRTWCTGYAATSRRTPSRARRCSACRAAIPGWRNGWGRPSNVGVTPIWRRPDVHRPPRPFSANIWRSSRSPSCHPLSLADCSTRTPVRTFQSNLYLSNPSCFSRYWKLVRLSFKRSTADRTSRYHRKMCQTGDFDRLFDRHLDWHF